MRAYSAAQIEQQESAGPRAITDSLNLRHAPILQTNTACKSGLAFLEIASAPDDLGTTEPVHDDAFLIALQLQSCPDFDLYADGRLIRPREFEAGAVAIFDLRAKLAMDRRDPFHAVDLYIPRKSLAHWQERRAKELLASNLTGGITLAELAKACELSIRHFTRAFRASTGLSPHRWLLQLRIEKAQSLLTISRRTLAEIALDCGFADQSHFSRVFHRSVGLSPGAWQRMHRR